MKKHSEPLPNLGDIVRASRKEKDLTLEKLSILSGISKSMLSQIERGTVSPTFTVVWNLTQCLGIDLSVLGESATTDNLITHTPAYSTPVKGSEDERCTLRMLNPLRTVLPVEWYELIAEAGGVLDSVAHAHGTFEHLSCLSGALQVSAGELTAIANAGDTLRYRADQPHSIHNIGDGPATALLVVGLPTQYNTRHL